MDDDEKSVYDLNTIDPWVRKYNKKLAIHQKVDNAQISAGKYYEDNLKKTLDTKWQEKFNLKPEYNKFDVEVVRQKYLALNQLMAPLYCSQLLSNGFEDDSRKKPIIRGWDMCKVNNIYGQEKKSQEFGEMFNELYHIAFLEECPRMNAYLKDPKHWAEKYYNYYNDETNLCNWQEKMKNLTNENVNPMIEIKNIVTKLELLGSSDYAEDIQKILYGAAIQCQAYNVIVDCINDADVKNIENVLNELCNNGSDDFKTVIEELKSHYGSISNAAKEIAKVYTSFPKGTKITDDLVKKEMRSKISVLKDKAEKIFNVICYGVSLGSFIKSIIGDDVDVAKAIGFGKATLSFTSDLITKILAKNITKFFLKKSEMSLDSNIRKISLTLAGWFTKEGVPSNNVALGIKLFGKNVTKFAARIAVLTAVIGFGLSCYDLAKAIKDGGKTDIIFASLNAAISLAGVVVTLGFVAGAAWAGPIGWVVAIIGAVVAIIELLYELFGPKPPPPDPLQEYNDQVMGPKNYLNIPTNYYYAFARGKLCKVRDNDFSETTFDTFPIRDGITMGGVLRYNDWIYVYSDHCYKFKENDPEPKNSYIKIMNSYYSLGFLSCVLYGNNVFAISSERRVCKWDIREDNPFDIENIKSNVSISTVVYITTDKRNSIYVIDKNSIYKHDLSTESGFDKWVDVVTYGDPDFDHSISDFKYYNDTLYASLGNSLYTIDIKTKNITRIFGQYDWWNSSFVFKEINSNRTLLLVSGSGNKRSNLYKRIDSTVSMLATYKNYDGLSEQQGYDSFEEKRYHFHGIYTKIQ